MRWIITLCCLLTVMETLPEVLAGRLDDIYWNSSNPMFRIDNTDHIIDVNKGNIPFEYDQVNIICPVFSSGTKEEDTERYIIYNVSKEEYDSCRITNPASRIIALCDKPHQLMYFTITFRSFTPQPGGLEFLPGQDYYFISTSGGSAHALDQKVGGRCATHNMRVIFKVCCGPNKNLPEIPSRPTTSTSTTILPSSSTAMSSTVAFPSKPSTTTYVYRFHRPTYPPYRPRLYTSKPPLYKSYDFPREEGKVPSKKTEDRDKLPNETRAKNEELVKGNYASARLQHNFLTTATALLTVMFHHHLRR